MIGGWDGRRPTLLGILNKVLWRVGGFGLGHRIYDNTGETWHPWWHGKHIPGSWYKAEASP